LLTAPGRVRRSTEAIVTEDRTDENVTTPGADGRSVPARSADRQGAAAVPAHTGERDSPTPEDADDPAAAGSSSPQEAATEAGRPAGDDEPAAAGGRARPSREGVGSRLPEGLRDLAAAIRAIERGDGAAAPTYRAGPAVVQDIAGRATAADRPAGGLGADPRDRAAAEGGAEAFRRTPGAASTGPGLAAGKSPGGPAPQSPDAVAAARAVLAAGGAPETLAEAAVEALGERAGEMLREDPWHVLSVGGVRVDQADGFAKALLGEAIGPQDERRVQALVVWLLERAAEHGHTALESSVVHSALERQGVADADEALRSAVSDGRVLVFHDTEDVPGAKRAEGDDEDPPVRLLFGLDRYALAEESLADGLGRLRNTFDAAGPTAGIAEADWEGAAASAPSPSSATLIRAVAASGLVVHTGGEAARDEPAALVTAVRSLGLRGYAAAFTESGRRRLAALVGDDAAVSVAGLLTGSEGPGRTPNGALALDLLAVLDAPQLDVELAATLVESVPDGARLVLSGDPGVLWSAGPGRVFADLLSAKTCPQVASRTADPGPIGELVSGIGFGELEQVEAPEREVVIVPVRDAGEAVHRTVQLVADSVPRVIGVPAEHTQVITPGHGGAAGTRVLNAALKERLNPGPGRFGGFDPGDRVVHVPASGRAVPGNVVSADAAGLHLDCSGVRVVVPPDQVGRAVRHGWAMTAHQAVGTRWPAAVVVLPADAAQALTRAWVYTAFGRAEHHLSVVQGAEQALPRAVAEVPAKDRTTRLRTVLREQPGGTDFPGGHA
jgi:hypothetical protein